MRDLTKEELKLAPEWVTEYLIGSSTDVAYFISPASNKMMLNIGKREVMDFDSLYREDELRPIHRNHFDITEHEFSCENFKACKPSWIGDDLQVEIIDSDFTHHEALLNKTDAIAIAKALGVTGKDLL